MAYNNDDLCINNMIRKIMIDRDINITTIAKQHNVTLQTTSKKLRQPNLTINQLCQLAYSIGCDIQISCVDQLTGDILDTVTLNTHLD